MKGVTFDGQHRFCFDHAKFDEFVESRPHVFDVRYILEKVAIEFYAQ